MGHLGRFSRGAHTLCRQFRRDCQALSSAFPLTSTGAQQNRRPLLTQQLRFINALGKGTDLLPAFNHAGGLQRVVLEGYVPDQGFMVTDYNRPKWNENGTFPTGSVDDPESGKGRGPLEMDLLGSIIATNHTVYLWRNEDGRNSAPEDLRFWDPLKLLMSKQPSYPNNYDLVLIGMTQEERMKGLRGSMPDSVWEEIKKGGLCNADETPVEVMEIGLAMAQFNIMTAEDRNVLCALVL